MIASVLWHRLYQEIRLLMQAGFYTAANETISELVEASELPSHFRVCNELRAECEAKIRGNFRLDEPSD
jgi:hypothetical protein